MKLIISFFLIVINSNTVQSQPFTPIFDAQKKTGNDPEIALAIQNIRSAIISKIKDVGISPLKSYYDKIFDNIVLHLLISPKFTLNKQIKVQS